LGNDGTAVTDSDDIIGGWAQLNEGQLHYSIIIPTTAYIYKIYEIYTLKHKKRLRHISVLRPSSGSYIFLAKVTL